MPIGDIRKKVKRARFGVPSGIYAGHADRCDRDLQYWTNCVAENIGRILYFEYRDPITGMNDPNKLIAFEAVWLEATGTDDWETYDRDPKAAKLKRRANGEIFTDLEAEAWIRDYAHTDPGQEETHAEAMARDRAQLRPILDR